MVEADLNAKIEEHNKKKAEITAEQIRDLAHEILVKPIDSRTKNEKLLINYLEMTDQIVDGLKEVYLMVKEA